MASVALLKPGSVPDLIKQGTTVGGVEPDIHSSPNGTENRKLMIKVQRASVRVGTQVIETTGSGDTHSKYEHNEQGSGSAVLTGFVTADPDMIGLVGLYESSYNPYGVVLRLGQAGSGNYRVLVFELVVQNVDITYIKNQPVVGISIQGVMTEFADGSDPYIFRESNESS